MSIGERLQAQAMNQRDAAQAHLGNVSSDDSGQIEIDGEMVSIAELKKGYMRQADYTRKTQEIAEAKRKLGAEDVDRVRAELDQYKSFYANVNAFLAKRPDVYKSLETFANTDGREAGDATTLAEPDKKPETTPKAVDLPEEVKQKLAILDSLQNEFKSVRGSIAEVKADKAIQQLMEEMGVKRREDLSPAIKYAADNWNPQKDYLGNLRDAYRISRYEEERQEEARRREKENAMLFSGKDSSGNPRQKQPGELLLEALEKDTGGPKSLFS